eukprot:gene23983-29030_t
MEGVRGDDRGQALAVDAATGDVYVTGHASGSLFAQVHNGLNDIILVKYGSNATRLWARFIGTTGNDIGYGVSVHPSTGDVYVAGTASGSLDGETYAGDRDIVLLKFARTGARLWARMVGTTGVDIAWGVSVDSNTGDVYIAGQAAEALHGQTYIAGNDTVLIKFASDGTRLWTRMEGTAGSDISRGVAVHSATGDVYVTGEAGAALHGQTYVASSDVFLMKYGSDGTRAWTVMVGTSGADIGFGVAVHPTSADIYVTGQAGAALHGQTFAGGGVDVLLMKFASNGTRIYTRMVGTNTVDIGYAVSVQTSTGDVFVSGETSAAIHGQSLQGLDDILIMRYSSDGTRVWTRMLGSASVTSDKALGIAVNPSNSDLFVTGLLSQSILGLSYAGMEDFVITKYSTNGTRVWLIMDGTSGSDIAYGVAAHPTTGDVFITGHASGAIGGEVHMGQYDIFVAKYSKEGARLWFRMVGTTADDFGWAISVDATSAEVVVTGQAGAALHGQAYGGSLDVIIMKYASNGTRLWTRMVGNNLAEDGRGVAVHPTTGEIYFVRNGTRVWTRMVGSTGADDGRGVAVHPTSGDVYVTGRISGSVHGQSSAGSSDFIVM